MSQYGITWRFERPYRAGRFINGDWWVVPGLEGQVVVSEVSPGPRVVNGHYLNGSMINPLSNRNEQGYDSRATFYNSALSVSFPIGLSPGASLVSTTSIESHPYIPDADTDPFPNYFYGVDAIARPTDGSLKDGAVLTVLSAPPPGECFRPGYVGPTKRMYCRNEVHDERLPRLSFEGSRRALAILNRATQRPDLDLLLNHYYRSSIAGARNRNSYGRDYATLMGDSILSLCLDYSDEEKEQLLIQVLQIGIDLYNAFELNPDLMRQQGGYSIGREVVIRFAGHLFNDQGMLNLQANFAEKDFAYFGEDMDPPQQLWSGWQSSEHPFARNVLFRISPFLDNRLRPHEHESRPLSEWASLAYNPDHPDTRNYPWTRPELYQRLLSYAAVGPAIAVRLLGLENYVSAAFLAYVDRWMYSDGEAIRNALALAAVQYHWNELSAEVGDFQDYENPNGYLPFEGTCFSPMACAVYREFR